MAASIFDWSKTPGSNDVADSGINWAENQAPSTVNNSARQMMGRVAELLDDLGGVTATTNVGDAFTLTANSGASTLADGLIVGFKANASNSGAATLNVNATGAKAIRYQSTAGDAALTANMIRANGLYVVTYSTIANGAAGAWILKTPSVNWTDPTFTGDVTLSSTSPDLIINKAASGQEGGIVGKTNGLARWTVYPGNATAESGSNAGSNFSINAYNDAGALLSSPVTITRSSGAVTLSGALSVAGATTLTGGVSGDVTFANNMTISGTLLVTGVSSGLSLQTTGSAQVHWNTAIPAGGALGKGLFMSSNSAFGVYFGSGAPTVSAAKGSLYLRSDGSTTNNRMYVNTDGATAWTAVTTAA